MAFGGNKTRKLEFLIAEAQERGAKTLISAGALQSNHCRQTAAAAARFGMDCILILTGERSAKSSANFLLDELFGAEIIIVVDRTDRDRVLQETYEQTTRAGRNPYLVPYGGSSATGALGYVFAVEELMSQGVKANWVVFGSSSGGTHAGLILGQRVFKYQGKVLGISIDEPEVALKAHVADLASKTSERLGKRITFNPDDVLATANYCRAGYGVLTDLEREAIKLFAKYEGVLLDPVYTGRAAGGMIDLIKQGFFKKEETVLFWHTGGQPALFAEKYEQNIF